MASSCVLIFAVIGHNTINIPIPKYFKYSRFSWSHCNPCTSMLLFQGHSIWRNFPGEWTPHMKGVGMLVGNFELNPQRRPIWAWLKLFLSPKRDQKNIHIKYIFLYFFTCNPKRDLHTLRETKIRNLHP